MARRRFVLRAVGFPDNRNSSGFEGQRTLLPQFLLAAFVADRATVSHLYWLDVFRIPEVMEVFPSFSRVPGQLRLLLSGRNSTRTRGFLVIGGRGAFLSDMANCGSII